MMKAGRGFLAKQNRTIRVTLTIDLPYDNELLNYGKKLDSKLREVINNTEHLCCSVQAGYLEFSKEPVIDGRKRSVDNIT